MNQRQAFQSQVDDLQEEKSSLKQRQRGHDRLQRKLADVEAEIDDRTETLGDFEEQQAEVETQIEQLTSDLEDIKAQIADNESKLDDREQLKQQREQITTELAELRTKIEDLQTDAVEEFNSHMDALLDRLAYENLERVWIERTETEVREGRRKVTKDQFELHVVRSTDSETVYEDVVDHLSESEREITGLVFALAGYLVHEVYDHVPFMLLDSIEAVDSDRIARLVDYLSSYSNYLVVALLEEDAQALNDSYPRIESIDTV
jgi:DNA repair exonuclease SbcCD ATPase subunit